MQHSFKTFKILKDLKMALLLIVGHFWCTVVTSVTFNSNLSNFENNPKNPKNIQKKSKK